MAVDTKKLFDEELPAAMERNPEEAKSIGAKYQMNITDSGEWYIDVSPSGPKVEKGNPGTADCTITISEEDFQTLQANPQSAGMQLYMSGKLKVAGNPMLAMKLQKLFALKLASLRFSPPRAPAAMRSGAPGRFVSCVSAARGGERRRCRPRSASASRRWSVRHESTG
jgi:putative sterol carrier protein